MARDENMISALLRERAGYARRGLEDRVAAVDEQLRLRGAEPPAEQPAAPATPVSRSTPPKGRRARGSETA